MPALVETMFSVREVPWHGMGVIIQDAPTSDEAIKVAGLDWNVKQRPACFQAEDGGAYIGTEYMINYRDSDNAVLGLVGNRYSVVQNYEAFEFTDELVGGGDVKYETAGSLCGGRVVWLLARLPEMSLLGDSYHPYLLFSNTHDGSGAVRITQTPVRVVCNNTLNIALSGAERSFSFLHKGDIKSKINEARRVISATKKYHDSFSKTADRLATKHISESDAKAILDKIFPVDYEDGKITKVKLNNQITLRENFVFCMDAPDLSNFRGTAWGLIQAASDFAYHSRPLRLTGNYCDTRMLKVINGNPLLDKVVSLVNAA